MKIFLLVVSVILAISLLSCHPKKLRSLEPEEKEGVTPSEEVPSEKEPVWGPGEKPVRPIELLEAEPVSLKDVHFDFDKYNLTDEATVILGENAEGLMKHSGVSVLIEGHCDERGTEEYNLALGEKRAIAARDFLVRFGIDNSQVAIISYGEENPVDPGHDEEAWAKNRRAHFVIR